MSSAPARNPENVAGGPSVRQRRKAWWYRNGPAVAVLLIGLTFSIGAWAAALRYVQLKAHPQFRDDAVPWQADEGEVDRLTPLLVLSGAVCATLLLAGVIWSMSRKRTRALALAQQVTRSLKESEHKLQSILDNTAAVVYVKDINGRYLLVNRSFAQLFATPPQQVVGLTDHDLFPRDVADAFRASDREVLESQKPIQVEQPVPHADGPHTHVTNKFLLYDDLGLPYAVCGVSTDLMPLRRAEEALRDAEARYFSLVESLPLSTWSKDLEGRFTFANRRMTETLKLPLSELLGTTDYDHFTQELSDKYRRDDQQVIETKSVFEDVEEFQKPDGERIYFHTLKAPVFNARGNVIGTQGMAWDVTARQQAEAAMRSAKDAAESANRAKSAFLANISHEIRTPLNGVIGMTELVLESRLTSEQREHLTLAKQSAEALLKVINNVLDLSKIEAGRLDLDERPMFVRELLRDAAKTLHARAQQRGLDLAFRVGPDVPYVLIGDDVRLRQILLNLIGNAIKFTERGTITVAADRATPEMIAEHAAAAREEARGDHNGEQGPDASDAFWLHVLVRDTGIGIPAEKQRTVFEAFEQADTSTTRKFGGTGLGLTISLRLVELMGGRIWLESVPGKGSTFHFTARMQSATTEQSEELFAAAGAVELPALTETPFTPQRRLNVLVAEDSDVNQRLCRALLEKWGHKVTIARNGREVLSACAGQIFDLVLMDVQMPEMDGFEATAALRQRDRAAGRHTPIIATTAHSMAGDCERCLEAGMDAFLSKPIRSRELREQIETLIQLQTHSPEKDPRSTTDVIAATVPVRRERTETTAENGHWNLTESLDALQGDWQLLQDMARAFLDECPAKMRELQAAIAANDAAGVRRAAHTIKGAVSHFGATAAYDAAWQLEQLGREGAVSAADGPCRTLQTELQSLLPALESFAAEPEPLLR